MNIKVTFGGIAPIKTGSAITILSGYRNDSGIAAVEIYDPATGITYESISNSAVKSTQAEIFGSKGTVNAQVIECSVKGMTTEFSIETSLIR
ncbi:MAG: hypothetical protein PHV06_05285 [bacterium]|nr:hypothetical protein [bacterium]